jgi:hypothetical protein
MLSKYKTKGAVIDSTLLLLLILGNYDIRSVGRDRTQKYSANDHRLMVHITDYLDKIIITPNILTEVDNLSRQRGTDTARLANVVRSAWAKISEIYRPSEIAIGTREYEKVGLTDTHILAMASENHLIITDDLPLYHWLESSHRDAININHIRNFT